MEWYFALIFLLGSVLGFMFIGVPVALAFLAANMIGATYFMGRQRRHFYSNVARHRAVGE